MCVWRCIIYVCLAECVCDVFVYVFLQMTAQEVRLCGLLLQEHFGEVVEKVGTQLIRSGALTLRAIVQETNMPLDLVQFHPFSERYTNTFRVSQVQLHSVQQIFIVPT